MEVVGKGKSPETWDINIWRTKDWGETRKGKPGQINETEEPRECGMLAGTVSMRWEWPEDLILF